MSKRELKRLERCAELAAARGYRLAFALVGSRHDAEDLVAQALSIATAKAAQIPRNPWPWFAKMITFEARNLRRKVARRGPSEILDDPPDGEASPLERALSKELNARLWQAYQGLEESERETLALVHLAGLSRREAAKQRGVSATSLRRELDGALTQLRAELGVSDKAMLAALPLLFAAPSAAFISSLGTITAAPASGAGFLTSASSIISGGFIMKKYAAAIIIILLLLSGGGAWLVFGGGDSEAPRLASADKKKIEQEGKREGVLEEADLGKKNVGVEGADKSEVGDNLGGGKDARVDAAATAKESEEILAANPLEEGIVPNTIRFQIVDKEGNPRPTAWIWRQMVLGRMERVQKWPADANGVIEFTLTPSELLADQFGMWATDELCPSQRVGFDKSDLGTLQVVRLASYADFGEVILLDVTCRDPKGNPVAGMAVGSYGKSIPPQMSGRHSVTDSEGRARLLIIESGDEDKGVILGVDTYRASESGFDFTAPLITREVPASEYDSPIDITVETPFAIRGRALRHDRTAAAKAQISVQHFRIIEEGESRTRGSSWRARITSNDDGSFFIACQTLDEASLDFFWRNELTGQEERISIAGRMPNADGVIDLGDVVMERIFRFALKAEFEGKPLADALVQIRRDGEPAESKFTTDAYGLAFIDTLTARDLITPSGAQMEVRMAHALGVSKWLPVREIALAEEEVTLEVKPVPNGNLVVSFFGEKTDTSKMSGELILVDGPLGEFNEKWELASGLSRKLAVGSYTLSLKCKGHLLSRQESFRIAANQTTALRIELVAPAILKTYRSGTGIDPNALSVDVLPATRHEWQGAFAENEQNDHYLWPQEAYRIRVSYFVDGRLAQRFKDVAPMASGEVRIVWINDLVTEVESEIAQESD